MSLGRKDAIVINGGTNDIGNNSTKRNKALVIVHARVKFCVNLCVFLSLHL